MVVIFSGSETSKLDEVFGHLPVWLAAENGVYVRPPAALGTGTPGGGVGGGNGGGASANSAGWPGSAAGPAGRSHQQVGKSRGSGV